jgi:hypothetical protein
MKKMKDKSNYNYKVGEVIVGFLLLCTLLSIPTLIYFTVSPNIKYKAKMESFCDDKNGVNKFRYMENKFSCNDNIYQGYNMIMHGNDRWGNPCKSNIPKIGKSYLECLNRVTFEKIE